MSFKVLYFPVSMAGVTGTDEGMDICEPWLRGACSINPCSCLHARLPYIWQIHLENIWMSLDRAHEAIEMGFCSLDNDTFQIQTVIEVQKEESVQKYCALVEIKFTSQPYQAAAVITQLDNPDYLFRGVVPVRRLSTRSYIRISEEGPSFSTVWTWRWKDGQTWKMLGKDKVQAPAPMQPPLQSVLEQKYLHGQEIYRFEYDEPGNSTPMVFIVDFRTLSMSNLTTHARWELCRRPAFISQEQVNKGQCPAIPERKHVPYSCLYPENWSPIDPQFDYELVTLNPAGFEYHLVASQVCKSLQGITIHEIYRIQNPYLWHKFDSKKKQFKAKGHNPNEQQLFHGTADQKVVKAIFRQNFDHRVSGKHAAIYGKGAYFAKDASYSHRYTGPEHMGSMHWMFMARVLVGAYTVGACGITRPPPRDPNKPYGDLYDSCVNDLNKPNIYVLFDTDQYYPQYAFRYNRIVNNTYTF